MKTWREFLDNFGWGIVLGLLVLVVLAALWLLSGCAPPPMRQVPTTKAQMLVLPASAICVLAAAWRLIRGIPEERRLRREEEELRRHRLEQAVKKREGVTLKAEPEHREGA
jgi:hypothetical protein